jgi:signal transduction histidine kinase
LTTPAVATATVDVAPPPVAIDRAEALNVHLLVRACGVGLLYALGALLPFLLIENPALGVAFFPSAGLTLAVLVLTSPRTWPVYLGAVAIAEIAVDVGHHQTFAMAVGFALANVVEPLVGASLLRRADRHAVPTLAGFVRFVAFAVVAGPFFGALIGASVASTAAVGEFVSIATRWWFGDALGVLVVAPLVLAWAWRHDSETRAGTLEVVVLSLLAASVTLVPTLVWHTSIAFAVLPVIMWAALRAGSLGIGSAGFASAMSVDWLFASGRADTLLQVGSTYRALIEVQVFIAVTLLAAHILAIEIDGRVEAERRARQSERARILAQLAARDIAASERRRIARETHDIVGHALNVMLLSTAAARRTIDTDVDGAREMLENVEAVGRGAFADLDVALGLMDPSDHAPGNGIDDLPALVVRVGNAGLPVELRVSGEPRPIPTLVDWSVYRIVQECLTNVMRHAGPARTSVEIAFAPAAIRVTVVDAGGARVRRPGRSGRGIAGMRERVEVLGGHLDATARPHGFEVVAEIPLAG